MSCPSSTIRPARAGSRPMTARSTVVLPTPLRPMRQTTCPAGTVRSTPHRTCEPPYATSSFSTDSMGLLALAQVDLLHARVALHLLARPLAQHAALVEHGDG